MSSSSAAAKAFDSESCPCCTIDAAAMPPPPPSATAGCSKRASEVGLDSPAPPPTKKAKGTGEPPIEQPMKKAKGTGEPPIEQQSMKNAEGSGEPPIEQQSMKNAEGSGEPPIEQQPMKNAEGTGEPPIDQQPPEIATAEESAEDDDDDDDMNCTWRSYLELFRHHEGQVRDLFHHTDNTCKDYVGRIDEADNPFDVELKKARERVKKLTREKQELDAVSTRSTRQNEKLKHVLAEKLARAGRAVAIYATEQAEWSRKRRAVIKRGRRGSAISQAGLLRLDAIAAEVADFLTNRTAARYFSTLLRAALVPSMRLGPVERLVAEHLHPGSKGFLAAGAEAWLNAKVTQARALINPLKVYHQQVLPWDPEYNDGDDDAAAAAPPADGNGNVLG